MTALWFGFRDLPRAVRDGAIIALIAGAVSLGSAFERGGGLDLVGALWLVLAIGIARRDRWAIAAAFVLAGLGAAGAFELVPIFVAIGASVDWYNIILTAAWVAAAIGFGRAWRANEAALRSAKTA